MGRGARSAQGTAVSGSQQLLFGRRNHSDRPTRLVETSGPQLVTVEVYADGSAETITYDSRDQYRWRVIDDSFVARGSDDRRGISLWSRSITDLDNGSSAAAAGLGLSTKLSWRNIILTPDAVSSPQPLMLMEVQAFVKLLEWHRWSTYNL